MTVGHHTEAQLYINTMDRKPPPCACFRHKEDQQDPHLGGQKAPVACIKKLKVWLSGIGRENERPAKSTLPPKSGGGGWTGDVPYPEIVWKPESWRRYVCTGRPALSVTSTGKVRKINCQRRFEQINMPRIIKASHNPTGCYLHLGNGFNSLTLGIQHCTRCVAIQESSQLEKPAHATKEPTATVKTQSSQKIKSNGSWFLYQRRQLQTWKERKLRWTL